LVNSLITWHSFNNPFFYWFHLDSGGKKGPSLIPRSFLSFKAVLINWLLKLGKVFPIFGLPLRNRCLKGTLAFGFGFNIPFFLGGLGYFLPLILNGWWRKVCLEIQTHFFHSIRIFHSTKAVNLLSRWRLPFPTLFFLKGFSLTQGRFYQTFFLLFSLRV